MSQTIETSISIHAPAERVWSILADTSSYATWNPFIASLEGPLSDGARIRVELTPPGGGRFVFKPVVSKADGSELIWQGRVLIPGLFDGEHYFRLEAISERETRFVHGERFSGLLTRLPFMRSTFDRTREGFLLMNEALKRRAEAE